MEETGINGIKSVRGCMSVCPACPHERDFRFSLLKKFSVKKKSEIVVVITKSERKSKRRGVSSEVKGFGGCMFALARASSEACQGSQRLLTAVPREIN